MSEYNDGFKHKSCFIDSQSEDKAFWNDSKVLFDVLGSNALSMPIFVCIKDGKGVFNFGNVFIAAEQTLDLIKSAFSHGNLVDSYLLLRRIFESILQYLFFVEVTKKYVEENPDKEDESTLEDIFTNFGIMIKRMEFNDSCTSDLSFFHQWAVGNSMNNKAKHKRRNVITLSHYLSEINSLNPLIKECREKYLEPHLTRIIQVMNDYAHGNSIHSLHNNYFRGKEARRLFQERASIVFSILLVYLTLIRPVLLHSDDYIDFLEFNITPPLDSQYWIAPSIQKYFNTHVSKLHPEIVRYLKDNNISGMMIEVT